MSPARACLGLPGKPCGKIQTHGSRCEPCDTAYRTMMSAKRRDPELDSPEWRRTRDRILREWVAEHGWVCPGYGTEHKPHPTRDLTVDHRIPRAALGSSEPENLGVLCRSWNGRKDAATRSRPLKSGTAGISSRRG